MKRQDLVDYINQKMQETGDKSLNKYICDFPSAAHYACHKNKASTESVKFHPNNQACSLDNLNTYVEWFQDFWECLPDNISIRYGGFYVVCDISEHVFGFEDDDDEIVINKKDEQDQANDIQSDHSDTRDRG